MDRACRRLARTAASLLLGILPLAGCRMCATCDDEDYAAYGGVWQRTIRDHGRVGSIFSPAGARSPDLVPRDEPATPDEREREKRQSSQDESVDPDGDPETVEEVPVDPDAEPDRPADPQRRLRPEDIEIPGEDELRGRTLDDIETRIVPGAVLPPDLQ